VGKKQYRILVLGGRVGRQVKRLGHPAGQTIPIKRGILGGPPFSLRDEGKRNDASSSPWRSR